MEERRQAKRYEVAYHLEKKEQERTRLLELVDLSRGGASFTGRAGTEEQREMDVRLFLKKKRFDLKALVVNVKKIKEDLYRFGVKFLETPDDFIATLEKELEQITQHHREHTLYKRKEMSFREASEVYLKKPRAES